MFDLQVATATEAKIHLGQFLDRSQKSPIMIQKNKKDYSVLMSAGDFEDLLLSLKAYESMDEGFVGVDESEEFFKRNDRMIKVDFSQQSVRFLKQLSSKDKRIVGEKIQLLRTTPNVLPSKALVGHKPLRRIRVGIYRVVYYFTKDTLYIAFIGKRNDSEVYKML